MLKTNEMKNILYCKLQDESCYFTKKDISIKKVKDSYIILIKDYEHITFEMKFEYDEYFGYLVSIKDLLYNEYVAFCDSKYDYNCKDALLQLGYYIGTRF